MTKKPTAKGAPLHRATTLLVLGEDANGKPKAAVFSTADMETVFPAAKALNLAVHQPYTEHLGDLCKKLPTGRIYARGKAFIPRVRKALYDELQAEIVKAKSDLAQSQAERSATAPAQNEGITPMSKGQTATQASSTKTALVTGFPADWASIAAGHTVLIEEEDEGWWPAVVISRESDILTLRFRDYPKVPPVKRHISNVALLNPQQA
jgi:hypothetical protein